LPPTSRILVLVGPTAAGKTRVSLEIAQSLDVEIVNADSMQVYRGMDIGTDKPGPRERASVAHHLIDILDPDQAYSAARFQADADQAIRQILSRNRVPLVVGGTGLYIKALLHGLFPEVRGRGTARWEERLGDLRRLGENPYARLSVLDPGSAARIHPNDYVRAQRALEVFLKTGRSIDCFRAAHGFRENRYQALLVGLKTDRHRLNRRIHERVDRMIRRGWLEETRGLLEKGYAADLPAMRSLGYRHLVRVLRAEVSLEESREDIERDTRRYAKRQMTWFLNQEKVEWVEVAETGAGICDAIQRLWGGL